MEEYKRKAAMKEGREPSFEGRGFSERQQSIDQSKTHLNNHQGNDLRLGVLRVCPITTPYLVIHIIN